MPQSAQKFRRLRSTVFPVALVALLSSVFAFEAGAATYYLSPSGSDSNPGTSSAPWKTFNNAVRKLQAGDSLLLTNGTYNASNSGYLNVTCGTNAVNGTASQPITVKAENERQAFLSSDGTNNPVIIRDCSYWTIQGLRISNADKSPTNEYVGGAVVLFNLRNFTFRRNLVQYNNRYLNGALVTTETAIFNSLFEENELYDYHRNGLAIGDGSSGNVIRRNYVNPRNRADIPGGYVSGPTTTGDSGFVCYPCSNNIFENNIVERSGAGIQLNAAGAANNNRFYGNIMLNNGLGFFTNARGNDDANMPHSNYQKDFVVIGGSSYGVYSRASKDTRCDNCTILNNAGGIAADSPTQDEYGDKKFSFFSDNTLVANNNGYLNYGLFIVRSFGTWTYAVDYMNSYGQAINFDPDASDPSIRNAKTIDPTLQTCKVWIPDNSPMKRAGKNGADIGANILYRYENGVLTNLPLWNQSTGEFPRGAIIVGVNDISDQSAFDVHRRLNVNTNGCAFPAGYGSASEVPEAPGNLAIQTQ